MDMGIVCGAFIIGGIFVGIIFAWHTHKFMDAIFGSFRLQERIQERGRK